MNKDDLKTKEVKMILQAIEIPYELFGKEKTREAKLISESSDIKDLVAEAEKHLDDQKRKDNDSDDSDIADEYVEKDEIKSKAMETKKVTLRVRVKGLERRFSRMKLGKEVRVSLIDGMSVKWGINMDH